MPSITVQVDKVEHIISGVNSKGRQWHLTAVFAGGKRYTTFEGDEWQKRIGQEATFEYTEVATEKNGKKYVDLRISPSKKQDVGDFKAQLDRIETKLDMVLDVLKVKA